MRRVLIAGVSGSGKTTLARRVATGLGLPRYELDELHHGPGWVKRPEFETEVAAFAATDRWVCEAQYQRFLGNLLWERADTLLWLDLPRRTVMHRVIRRSVARAVTGRELFNGNTENWREWADPEHPIRWAWAQHAATSAKTRALTEAHPNVDVVHFTSAGEVRRWVGAQPWARSANRL